MSSTAPILRVSTPVPNPLSTDALARALAVRDLSDPARGPHAIQLVVDALLHALHAAWGTPVLLIRAHPLVPVEDNYERLGYPPGAVTRDARYSRYASETCMLRSHTSAMIPPALRDLARRAAHNSWHDVVLACPGIVYRRDALDRLHTGTPHQIDLWRIAEGRRLGSADLDEMISTVVRSVLPGAGYRSVPAAHPYTGSGRQIDVQLDEEWVEIGECGLAAPHVLARAGLSDTVSGLAMGLGLDRLLMLRKQIPDIRLLSATDPRIAGQMLDLAPYRPVSRHPPISRDLSIATDADADAETLGDAVRDALGPHAAVIEEVRVAAETPIEDLPAAAVTRLGAQPGHKNVLLRITLRHSTRTMSDDEANAIRDQIYASVHQGTAHKWAGTPPPCAP